MASSLTRFSSPAAVIAVVLVAAAPVVAAFGRSDGTLAGLVGMSGELARCVRSAVNELALFRFGRSRLRDLSRELFLVGLRPASSDLALDLARLLSPCLALEISSAALCVSLAVAAILSPCAIQAVSAVC